MGSQTGGQVGGMALMLGGKLIGSFLGGPIGGAIGGLAGGLIGSLLFNRGSKPMVADAQLASSSYGHFIPILYGQGRFPATIIWNTDIESKKHGVGKGQTAYEYFQSAAYAFVQGPARLMKVWLDGKLFFDATSAYPHEIPKEGKFVARIYNGTEDQLPDPFINFWCDMHVAPAGACPAYRGLAYIVAQEVNLGPYGNRMPNWTASWATDWEDKILVTRLQPSDRIPPTLGLVTSVAVDWLSYRAYSAVNTLQGAVSEQGDSTLITVYDMDTGIAIKAATYTEIVSSTAMLATDVPQGDAVFTLWGGLACCQGEGDLYLAVEGTDPYESWLIKIDTTTMRGEEATRLPVYGLGLSTNDIANYLFPFQQQAYGFDPYCLILIGTVNWGSWYIFDPKFAKWSGILPTHYHGGYPGGYFSAAAIGAQDKISGKTELWIVQASPGIFGPTRDVDYLHIHKVTLVGQDPTSARCEEVATLLPDDTGSDHTVGGGIVTFWWGVEVKYDPADDSIIISSGYDVTFKWKEGIGVIWLNQDRPAATGGSFSAHNTASAYTDLSSGRMGVGSVYDYWTTQTLDGKQSPIYNAYPDPGVTSIGVMGYHSGVNAAVIQSFDDQWNALYVVYLERAAAGEVPVASILLDLCKRAGIDAASVDVTQVASTTIGYSITEEKSYGNAIMDLCHTYQIDMFESDYKLKFVERGQAAIVTVQQADLASSDSADPSKYWEHKRAIEQEMPLQINLRYSDVDLDFQPGASYAKRIAAPVPTQFSRRVKTVDLPVVARNPDVRHIAEKWLYTMWAERDTYATRTGQKYIWLDPSDNIQVAFESGDLITVRVQTTEMGDDYSMKLDLCSEDIETYVTSTSPGAYISYVPQTISQVARIDLLQFNVPLLQDSDDTGGTEMRIYYAGGPTAPISSSATADLYQSLDGNAWPLFARMDGFGNWGTAVNALGNTVAAFATDYHNTLTYRPLGGSATPVSCTYEEMMNGANPVLVGREICQFQTAVGNADGSYTLSILLRGRRGSEYACGEHVSGEIVLFLEPGKVQAGRQPLSLRNATTMWKLVPAGHFIDSTSADSFSYRGFDLMPYAPVNAKRTLTGSDLVLTWIRRTRLGGLLVDGTDTVSLGEESELYEVYLLDDRDDLQHFDPAVPATYRRAFLGLTSPTVTYTASQMVTDGFDPITETLCAVIYQLSAVVGRGFPGFHVMPAPGGGLSVGLEDGTGSWTGWNWG